MAGAALGITSLALPAAASAASTVNPVVGASEVTWTSGDLFDVWTSRTSATTDLGASLGLDWQLLYAHQALTIGNGTAEAYGIGTSTSGTNSWTWYAAVSAVAATIGSFGTPVQVGRNAAIGNTSYAAGGFSAGPATADLSVPAGHYFLIGLTNGPFYRATRTIAAPRTGQVGESPAVTTMDVRYRNSTYGTAATVPSQLGGPGTGYTRHDGTVLVSSLRFSVSA